MYPINSKAYIIEFPYILEVVIFGYVIDKEGNIVGYKVFDNFGLFYEVSKNMIFNSLEDLKKYLKENWNEKFDKEFPQKDIEELIEKQLVRNEYKIMKIC